VHTTGFVPVQTPTWQVSVRVHAFPSVDNPPSNAICRKLGFELLEAIDFEYPPGSGGVLRCNDWRLDLDQGGMESDRR